MSGSLPPYLASLNPEQLEAVRHEGGSLLILAGAGSGKTRVITTKIAWLVRERGLEPESILAVTFTNKAAKEMRDRAAAIEPACSRAVIRTFHSFGAWFLRRNAAAAGLEPGFVIYDDEDQAALLHGALPQYTRVECSRMVQAISRAKDYGLEPDSPDLSTAFSDPQMRRIYAEYERRLRRTGNVDFGDLIRLPARLLEEDEAVRRRTRQRFKVILVDEYQDSNVAQFGLLRLLAGDETYVCVVGDDDQSIYRFRGAEVRNILSFPETFPGARIVRLERNYRSYQSILDVAGDVVSRNAGRLGKTLRAERAGGDAPRLALLEDQDAEAAYCARLCEERVAGGGSYGDVAVLYRTNAQSLAFEKEFPRRGIPYRIVGALSFYDREEVKDALAYLKILANPRDEVAWRRVVNKPARGFGDASLELLLESSEATGGDLAAAMAAMLDGSGPAALKGKARAGLAEFASILRDLGSALAGNGGEDDRGAQSADGGRPARGEPPKRGESSLARVVERLVKRSGLAEYHRSQDEVAGTQRLANLDELVNAASLYPDSPEGLADFLEIIELDRSLGAKESSADAVTLITMHNTKGLEFPMVIVTGLEQGLFPRDDDEGEELEEQRRLFYVAITRAKDLLYLTSCRWRRLHGRLFETLPSRFLGEIGEGRLQRARGVPGAPQGGSSRGAMGDLGFGARGAAAGAGDVRAILARVGRGGAGPTAGVGRGGPGAATGTDAADARWRAGRAVYHEDYGAGVIVKVSPTPSSGPLLVVRFETGKQAQFFPRFTKKLEASEE